MNPVYPKFISNYRVFRKIEVRVFEVFLYFNYNDNLRSVYNINVEESKGAKIRNRYIQVPHLTQDANGKVTNSQLDTTNESQEFSPFQAGDDKAQINRRVQRHSKHRTEKTKKIHKRSLIEFGV